MRAARATAGRRRRGGRAATAAARCPPRPRARRARRRRRGAAREPPGARRRCRGRDRAEAALLDELRAETGAGRQERQAHHRGPQAADQHPLRELAILDRPADDGGREARARAVRPEADVARDDRAQRAGGEQELDLEGAGEGDELEVAPAGARERARGGDRLAAQDGAAERDAPHPRRAARRRPSRRALIRGTSARASRGRRSGPRGPRAARAPRSLPPARSRALPRGSRRARRRGTA